MKDAIDSGYRLFDTSCFYCNEEQLGNGIRAKIAEGVVKREDIFIVTKVNRKFLCEKKKHQVRSSYDIRVPGV